MKHCSRCTQYYWYVSGPVLACHPEPMLLPTGQCLWRPCYHQRGGECTCCLRSCTRPMLSTASCSTCKLPRFADVCVHMITHLPPCLDCLVADCIVILARTCTGCQSSSRKRASLLCACPLFDCANRGDSQKRATSLTSSTQPLARACSNLPSQSCLMRTVAWSYHLDCCCLSCN